MTDSSIENKPGFEALTSVRELLPALEAGQVALFDYNHLSGALLLSPYWRTYLGAEAPLPTSLAEFFNHIHTDDAKHLHGTLHKDVAQKESDFFLAEVRLQRADTSPLRLRLRGRMHFDGDGDARRVMRTTGSAIDITGEDQMLRRSEERLAAILDNAQDAIISTDAKQRITLFNHGAENIFGYAAHEVIGKSLDILIPERFRHSHGGHFSNFSNGSVPARRMAERGEIFGLRKDGREFPAEASILKSSGSDGETFTTILRDITQRKKDEATLRHHEALLDIATSHAQVGLIILSRERMYLFANPTYLLWSGLDEDSVVGKLVPEVLGPQHTIVPPSFKRALKGERVSYEHIVPGKDGKAPRIYLRTLQPQTDEAGQVGSVIITIVDITEGKQTAEELSRLNRELEARVADRTRELQDEMSQRVLAQEALARSQRMESIGQLTGGIAHDFNNLLAVISGNLQLIDLEIHDERQRGYLSEAEKAVEVGVRLNQRLMTFARQRRFSLAVVNLNEIIIELRELLRRSMGENIELTTNLTEGLWSVKVDPGEIESAIINLVVNARDAMPSGGAIAIKTDNIVLGENHGHNGLTSGEYVKLAITDNGTGMSKDILAHAFEPFFTTKGEGKGTGLGLAVVYGFVKQSGGEVILESEVARGTIVNIFLPRCAEGENENSARRPQSRKHGSGELILVVEDRADVRRMVVAQLSSLGYRTLEAENGASALIVMQENAGIDLVFSDIVMPGSMSGFDLARNIRQTHPDQKILLTSGYSEDLATIDHAGLEEIPLLEKPYKLEKLSEMVRTVLGS